MFLQVFDDVGSAKSILSPWKRRILSSYSSSSSPSPSSLYAPSSSSANDDWETFGTRQWTCWTGANSTYQMSRMNNAICLYLLRFWSKASQVQLDMVLVDQLIMTSKKTGRAYSSAIADGFSISASRDLVDGSVAFRGAEGGLNTADGHLCGLNRPLKCGTRRVDLLICWTGLPGMLPSFHLHMNPSASMTRCSSLSLSDDRSPASTSLSLIFHLKYRCTWQRRQ